MKRGILAALMLTACSSTPQWQKEGITAQAAEADLYTCRSEVPIEPRVQGPSGLPPAGRGQQQSAAFETMADREGARMQKEQRYIDDCMRAKGYSTK